MAKLVDIKDKAPNKALIEQLEQHLKDAKSGEIRTMLSITGWDDDSWSHSWAIDDRNSKRRLLGELSMLCFDIHTNTAFADEDSVLSRAFDCD